jgi:hypothetical protein
MRVFEYLVLTLLVSAGAIWLATVAADAISKSFEQAATTITERGQ